MFCLVCEREVEVLAIIYTYNMTVYAGKDRKHVTPSMTSTHVNVTERTVRTENVGHTLYMDCHSMNRLTSRMTFKTFHDKVSLSNEHQTHTHTHTLME